MVSLKYIFQLLTETAYFQVLPYSPVLEQAAYRNKDKLLWVQTVGFKF